jgi:hypothetical protein
VGVASRVRARRAVVSIGGWRRGDASGGPTTPHQPATGRSKLHPHERVSVVSRVLVRAPRSMPNSSFSCRAPGHTNAVIIFGMSRSGTSLATSIVASIIGGGPETWRGSGAAYPVDGANRLGYYERADVVHLNYAVLGELGFRSWTQFDQSWLERPAPLNASTRVSPAITQKFQARASPIAADMARNGPYVLKDVRFSRTLPLWAPSLRAHGTGIACIIPFRHPAEVRKSSRMPVDRLKLWRSYNLAALASARSVGCPVILLDYARWFSPEDSVRQLDELIRFLRCAGVRFRQPGAGSLQQSGKDNDPESLRRTALKLVRSEEKHHQPTLPIPGSASCLLSALRTGKALKWQLDGRHVAPCNTEPRASYLPRTVN